MPRGGRLWSNGPAVCEHGRNYNPVPFRVDKPKLDLPDINVAMVGWWPALASQMASWGLHGH